VLLSPVALETKSILISLVEKIYACQARNYFMNIS